MRHTACSITVITLACLLHTPAHAGSCQAKGTPGGGDIQGIRITPDGVKRKLTCKFTNPPPFDRQTINQLTIGGTVTCADAQAAFALSADVQALAPPILMTGQSLQIMDAAGQSVNRCVSDLTSLGAERTIHYTPASKTADSPNGTMLAKEKGPLVYTLPDGTIFVGTMQLKY